MQEIRIVIVTYPLESEHERIAEEIIKNKLAASINITRVNSIYYWEEKIHRRQEVLFVIKTHSSVLEELKQFILASHPYKVPQIIEITPVDVYKPYSDWIKKVTVGDKDIDTPPT